MNKERQVIEPGTIIYFDRDVKGEELESLSGKSLTVVICGDLLLEKYFRFKGNLCVNGDVNGEQNIEIDGDFICSGEIALNDIYIKGNLKTYDCIQTKNIWVCGDFYADSGIDSHKITVEKLFCAEDINSLEICVGEDFYCESVVANNSDIDVAGDFECIDGIESAACITVLGRIHLTGTIEANEIKVGY